MLRSFLFLLLPLLAAAAEPPNIVYIISDDQDYEHLGFMGHPQVRTPNLDRLAGAGTVFTHGYLPAPVCRPTLAALLSGREPHQSGIYTNYLQTTEIGGDTTHIDPADSLALRLREAGYATYASGKFWEGDARRQGFTHGTVEITFRGFYQFVRNGQDELLGFIDDHAGEKPMFIWWAPLLPHTPHNPPERLLDLYPPESIEIPAYVRPERRESFVEDERKLLAMTSWFDEGLGELLGKLEAAGQLDNTLFAFVIDNGWANGLPSKHSAHEKSLRSPIFLTWADEIPAGRRIDRVTLAHDLYPTLLDYAGAEVPEHAVGESLRPVLERRQAPEDEIAIGGIYPHDATDDGTSPAADLMALFRRGPRWKMVWYLRDFTIDSVRVPNEPLQTDFIPHEAGEIQLFDLRHDPYEQRDLAGEPQQGERVTRFREEMLDWWRETGGAPIPHLAAPVP